MEEKSTKFRSGRSPRKAHGDGGGTRALVEVLLLHRHHAYADVVAGITAALGVGPPIPSGRVRASDPQTRSATRPPGLDHDPLEVLPGRARHGDRRLAEMTELRSPSIFDRCRRSRPTTACSPERAARAVDKEVQRLRRVCANWPAIASALGVSRQAARQRYAASHDFDAPAPTGLQSPAHSALAVRRPDSLRASRLSQTQPPPERPQGSTCGAVTRKPRPRRVA